MLDCCRCVAVIISLRFEMLEDKHCLGVRGFDREIIVRFIRWCLVLILFNYCTEWWVSAHIWYLCYFQAIGIKSNKKSQNSRRLVIPKCAHARDRKAAWKRRTARPYSLEAAEILGRCDCICVGSGNLFKGDLLATTQEGKNEEGTRWKTNSCFGRKRGGTKKL